MNTKQKIDNIIEELKDIKYKIELEEKYELTPMYQSLLNLVQSSMNAQVSSSHGRYMLDFYAYLQEYCTIRLSGPRQTGHTDAIVSLIKNNYNILGNTLLLVRNLQELERVRKKLNKVSTYIMMAGYHRRLSLLCGQRFDTIIVDGASELMTYGDEREFLYHINKTNGSKFLIYMQ